MTEPPRARTSDPWTSHFAAASVEATLKVKQQKVLSIYKMHRAGLTHWELDVLCDCPRHDRSTWRSRAKELRDLGLIVDTGRTKMHPDTVNPALPHKIWCYHSYANNLFGF